MHRSTTTPAHARARKLLAASAATLLAASGTVVAAQAATAAELPTVVINEVESSGGTPADWVELKNVGAYPVDVSGFVVKDNDDARVKAIPADTTIAPGAYFTFVVDEDPDGFGLGGGDSARLFLPDGTTLVDETSWGPDHATHAWRRCDDGTGAFVLTTASTPGAANACPDAAATLKINEAVSDGGAPGDWIELVNTGDVPVNAGGLVVLDNKTDDPYTIPADTWVAASGYLVLDNGIDFLFGLGKGDSVRLFDTDGTTLLDSTTFPADTHAAPSWARCPDASGTFAMSTASSKGAANTCATTEPEPATSTVVINEVESSGGTPGDWVELYNLDTENSVDLSGWRILDGDATHTAVPFAPGTTIESGGYLVLDEAFLGFGIGSGDTITLYSGAVDPANLVDSTTWVGHSATSWARCPDGTGAFADSTAPTKGLANTCGSPVRVNEIESSGGTPVDWIELVNTGTTTQTIGGMILKDNDDSRTFAIPAGTTLAAGAFLAIDVDVTGGFGLGGADSARLYAVDGTTLLDSYTWTAHASTTYGRCPDVTGEFTTTSAPTKGAPNTCPGVMPVQAWPGGDTLTAVPTDIPFADDLSGLDYEQPALGSPILWAVTNGSGTLSKMTPGAGGAWNGASGWGAGKQLAYPDGSIAPDAEGVTVADGGSAGGIYVATERSSAASGVSRPSILRYDVSGSGSTLTATNEWNLGADLTATEGTIGNNSGLEGITWIPDAVLTARGFVDESTGLTYDPADYPSHGGGVFFVALEATGDLYAYVLDLAGSGFQRVATIDTPGAMEVDYEPESGRLWAVCDEVCDGRTATLQVGESGAFEVTARYARPAASANYANEGFAIAPQSACVDERKPVFYADDAGTDGVALRVGSIRCTELGGGGPGTDPGTGPGTDPGTDPDAPSEDDLTEETENEISGPASAQAGGTITLQLGVAYAGQRVSGTIFSTPTSLSSTVVTAAGSARFTIPASVAAGTHRIAVYDASGAIIGWYTVAITPAALGATGAEPDAGLGLAAALFAGGLLLVGARALARRRTAPHPAG